MAMPPFQLIRHSWVRSHTTFAVKKSTIRSYPFRMNAEFFLKSMGLNMMNDMFGIECLWTKSSGYSMKPFQGRIFNDRQTQGVALRYVMKPFQGLDIRCRGLARIPKVRQASH